MGNANQKIQTLNFVLYFHVIISIYVVFFFLSVSIRCLTKDKLKKRKHGKHIFLKQYAFQTKGSSAVGVSRESKLLVRADVAGRVGVYRVKDRFILLLSASPLQF